VKLLDALIRPKPSAEVQRHDVSWLLQMLGQHGSVLDPLGYRTSYGNHPAEPIGEAFVDYAHNAYKANGIVYACQSVRLRVFAEARFQFQRMAGGRPGELFGTEALRILERPWTGGTTGDLLSRMILDADLAGNWFGTIIDDEVVRLRPDWVDIVLEPRVGLNGGVVGMKRIGYIYYEGGRDNSASGLYASGGVQPEPFLPGEVAHFAPSPDPLASYRGMSWLTPVVREIQSDSQATKHKLKFFENAASPNLAIRATTPMTPDQFQEWVDMTDAAHKGVDNAYKCLHPDTDVALWDGRRMPARGIAPGDVIVAWKDGKPVPGAVSEAEWQPPSPIVTVTTQRGRVIRTNDQHPFLVGDRWVDASRLRPGDMLTTGLGWGDGGGGGDLTQHEAWVLGALVGDGCLVSSTPVISAWDEGVRNRFGRDHELRHTGKGHDYRMLGVTKLAREHGLMGARSWEKRIPDQVMTGSASVRAAFLSGLVDTDGHVVDPETRRTMDLGITSVSRALLADAQHLLASLGVNTSLSQCAKPGRHSERGAWRLNAFGNAQARRLAEVLDLACAAKRERLSRYAATVALNGRDSSRFDRVVSVEIGDPEPTIGIEVADHHTHVTGGVVTHNTLYTAGGADVTVIGKDMRQMDFKTVQGAGETRVANAAGIHPAVVGLSEGMQGSSLNAGNFGAAKRATAQITMRPLWRNASGTLEVLVPPPGGSARLWYDDRDIEFLREDERDAAQIRHMDAQTMETLTRAGVQWDAAVEFVVSGEASRLRGKHSGLYSVQLQPPGTTTPDEPEKEPAVAASNGSSGG
jgi:hypothetical protein